MFWRLLLSHLLGDYLLQPDQLVKNKYRLSILAIHATIHFIVLCLFLGTVIPEAWPKLLSLALVHFLMDWAKGVLTNNGQKSQFISYLVDQFLHLFVIGLFAIWIEGSPTSIFASEGSVWVIYLCGYLIVTIGWQITERIFAAGREAYLHVIESSAWSRNIARVVLFTVWLALGQSLKSFVLLASFQIPYLTGPDRKRALWTDLVVTSLTALLVLSAS
jgi:hypothetical protein